MSDAPNGQSSEERLDKLFLAYKEACEIAEPSPNFMPGLWQKIEKQQAGFISFRRIARGFATAAAAICLMLAALALFPSSHTSPVYTSTYVDVLATNLSNEGAEYLEPVHLQLEAEN